MKKIAISSIILFISWILPDSVIGSGGFLLSIEPMTVLGIGAGVSALGSALSGIGAGRRARKMMDKMAGGIISKSEEYTTKDMNRFQGDFNALSQYEDMYKQIAEQYGAEAAKAYFDSAEGRSIVGQLERSGEKQRNRVADAVNLSGGSVEAMLAGMDNVNENVSEGITGLAGRADTRRMQFENMKMGALGSARGAASDRINLKQSVLNNARGFAGSIYGNAANYANNVVGQQTQNIANGFGQFGNALMMYGMSGSSAPKAAA